MSVRRWLATLALSVLATGVLPAQGATGPALKEAFARLAEAPREVAAMRAAQQRLGPYELDTQCAYCNSEFLWICTAHATERRRQAVDFRAPRGRIDAVLQQAERDAATLADGYAPAQAWIAGLPDFSARFDAIADVVLGVEQAIRQGAGPNERQRRDATQALLQLTGELGRASLQLDAGVHALALSIERDSAYRSAIQDAIDRSEESAQAALRDLDSASKERRCSDGLAAKFNAVKDDFSRAMQDIADAFERLDASIRQGEAALASLLDMVAGTRAEVESVLRLLAAAGIDQLDSFLGRLHFAAAKAQWNALAEATAP